MLLAVFTRLGVEEAPVWAFWGFERTTEMLSSSRSWMVGSNDGMLRELEKCGYFSEPDKKQIYNNTP